MGLWGRRESKGRKGRKVSKEPQDLTDPLARAGLREWQALLALPQQQLIFFR